jgi:hypothetical protein
MKWALVPIEIRPGTSGKKRTQKDSSRALRPLRKTQKTDTRAGCILPATESDISF